jgi:outer membrane lipoprotein SlyB
VSTGPADTHLGLEDLIAAATGQAPGAPAREHLARCQTCRAEANRWDLVAAGIRGLAATPAAAPQAPQPARPQLGPRFLARSPRRTILATSAAAAIVLAAATGAGVAAGVVHISVGSGSSGSSAGPALTAVSGCSALQEATGTLQQVNGTTLVIKTASGQPVTVTTTPSTFLSMSGPLVSDITDGAQVRVRGNSTGGTISASTVTVGKPFNAIASAAGPAPVDGTVTSATTTGFTLVTTTGTRIPVTTSAGTLVVLPHATPAQLQDGATTYAIGKAGPHGTLSARAIVTVQQLPQGDISVHTRSCSPSSIALALGSLTGS